MNHRWAVKPACQSFEDFAADAGLLILPMALAASQAFV
jgi:hypothetical protein